MVTAFKEWANIVDAIGKGRQNIILRKGGITEEGGEFTLKSNKFLLFPTQFHQSEEQFKPSWRPFLNGDRFQVDQDKVKIEYFVEVADTRIIHEWQDLKKVENYHAYTEDVIKERFNRWEKSVHLIIIQAYELLEPLTIELLPEYSGCKSWIEIDKDIDMSGKPVINPSIH